MPPDDSNDKPQALPLHVQAIDTIRRHLEWRGPTGKQMNHVVVPREQMEALLERLDDPKLYQP